MGLTGFDLHSLADRRFFEPPERIEDSHTRWVPPDVGDGVRTDNGDVWIRVTYGRSLPSQGWKIHLSSTVANAQRVLDATAALCREHRVDFKYLRSETLMLAMNSKYAHRGSAGKFVTVYPADVRSLKQLLDALAEALAGLEGPFILSDLRWNDTSPVFLRYGGFVGTYTIPADSDTPVLAITGPDGNLVADRRGPSFVVPDWAPVPDFVRERIDEFAKVSYVDLPYDIVRPLHFSNGGGVYLGTDKSTGEQVVLKEARPHAGLDAAGADAVTRLRREHDMLSALQSTGHVPLVHGYHVFWEHHFLVQEYVDGPTLARAAMQRMPHGPDASATELRDYTDWMLATIQSVEAAAATINAAGIVFGDLHPHNIIVRPDGHITFIDFEASHLIGADRTGLAGAPGFAAPQRTTGTDIDAHGLAALRIYQFIPLGPIAALDTDKPAQLAAWAQQRYPLPAGYTDAAVARLTSGAGRTDGPVPSGTRRAAPRPADAGWPHQRDLLTTAIAAAATPHRNDRLFPGSPDLSRPGGSVNLLHGAAGVLYALHSVGGHVPGEWTEWLVSASQRTSGRTPAGLFNGLHGVATVLDLLGSHEQARRLVGQAMQRTDQLHTLDITTGLPGAGLSLLGFHDRAAAGGYLTAAREIADQVLAALASPARPPHGSGLTGGFSGAALFLIRLYRRTGDDGLLDAACRALRQDLDAYREADGVLESRAGRGASVYLVDGLAGVGLALRAYLAQRPDAELGALLERIHGTLDRHFAVLPGLLQGRAGLLYVLAGSARQDEAVIARHQRDLWRYAVPYGGGLAFGGSGLHRLSMDLATGTAGVLLALSAAQHVTDRQTGPQTVQRHPIATTACGNIFAPHSLGPSLKE